MNRLRKKIRSRTGASLTFALLIFLVCAVVGSAVLVAGTAASGRMSKIAEMDQRYYSVNSAARLLIELIDGKTVIIVETKPETGSSEYEYGDGSDFDSEKFDSIVKEAAYYYITEIAPDDLSGRKLVTGADYRYDLNLSVGEISEASVAIKEELKDNGIMVLNVQNSGITDPYAMNLTFSPDIKKTEDKQETQTVTTWRIAWNLQNAETVGGNMRVK